MDFEDSPKIRVDLTVGVEVNQIIGKYNRCKLVDSFDSATYFAELLKDKPSKELTLNLKDCGI